jgi:hypothetical protein
MRHRYRTALVLLALVSATIALLFALAWGWSKYEDFVKRQKLTPIPVPAPP